MTEGKASGRATDNKTTFSYAIVYWYFEQKCHFWRKYLWKHFRVNSPGANVSGKSNYKKHVIFPFWGSSSIDGPIYLLYLISSKYLHCKGRKQWFFKNKYHKGKKTTTILIVSDYLSFLRICQSNYRKQFSAQQAQINLYSQLSHWSQEPFQPALHQHWLEEQSFRAGVRVSLRSPLTTGSNDQKSVLDCRIKYLVPNSRIE